jgi:predicted porin
MKQGSSFAKKQGTMIALACAAAFAAPQAMAQVATPDFGSGKGLTLSVDFLIGLASKVAQGATAGAASDTVRRTEVFSSSSSVYFKGSEKLNGDFLQGWGFVITWDYDPDEYNRRGSTEGGQTIMGVKTSVGDFFLGVNDNPFKQLGSVNVATGSSWCNGCSQSAVLGNPGFRSGTAKGGTAGSAAGGAANTTTTMSFYRLNNNSVNYYSPTMNGFKFYAQWVPGDSDTPTGATVIDPRAWSVGATYANGPFNAGYVYEARRDYLWGATIAAHQFGIGSGAAQAGTRSSDTGQVITAGYQFGNVKVGGYYQKLEYSQSGQNLTANALTDLSVDQWYIGARMKIGGPHEVAVFYATADNYDCNAGAQLAGGACVALGVGGGAASAQETGMKTYGIAYRYTVSKQLRFFGGVSRMDNERNAMYSGHSTSGNVGVGAGTNSNAAGLTFTNFSVGMQGSF